MSRDARAATVQRGAALGPIIPYAEAEISVSSVSRLKKEDRR
jgi:hypothetical protein